MPIVYSPILIAGEEYIDGGITPLGNNPIKILTELGYGSIALVSLDYMFNPYSLGDSIKVTSKNSLKKEKVAM